MIYGKFHNYVLGLLALIMIVLVVALIATFIIEKPPEFITEDELPAGYILQIRTEDYFEDFGKVDSVRISHGPHRIRLGQSYITDKGTKIKFCGFSDSEEIYISVDDGDLVTLRGSAAEIPNSDFYISYKDLKRESIYIRWSMDLQRGESIILSSGQVLTFVEFVNHTPMFKLE